MAPFAVAILSIIRCGTIPSAQYRSDRVDPSPLYCGVHVVRPGLALSHCQRTDSALLLVILMASTRRHDCSALDVSIHSSVGKPRKRIMSRVTIPLMYKRSQSFSGNYCSTCPSPSSQHVKRQQCIVSHILVGTTNSLLS